MPFLLFLLVLLMGGLLASAAYVLPFLIGLARRVPNLASLFVVNVFLGWTLIGWVVALAMAVRDRPVEPVASSQSRSARERPMWSLDTADFETAELRLAAAELPEDPFRSL
jgi:hypothetical protein